LFFEHDPVHECGTLQASEKGPRLNATSTLREIL
jgi:hypothetical protein